MHNVYFAVSAFDITHYDSVRTFAFNKRLIDQYQLESPYALVSAGKWTLDTYMEQGMAIANDVDGDGKWTSADMYSTDSNSNVYVNTHRVYRYSSGATRYSGNLHQQQR